MRGRTSWTIVLSLAVAIAANVVALSVYDSGVLRPFPFPEPERLVGIGAGYPKLNRPVGFFEVLSAPEYLDIRAGARAIDRVVAFDLGNEPVMVGETPERVFTAYVWDDPFQALGIGAAIGRGFTADELREAHDVAVVSHSFWQSQLEGDRAVIGRTLRVGGRPHTVVGVMPARARIYGTDLWVPMRDAAASLPRNRRQFNVIARLVSGVSIDEARVDLERVARQVEAAHAGVHPEYAGVQFDARPWTEIEVWGYGRIAGILVGAVAVILLLAITNLMGLIASRALGRRAEMAVRAALGADPARLAAMVWREAAVLAGLGAALGLAAGWLGLRTLPVWLPGGVLPDESSLALTPFIVSVVAGVTVVAALALGLVSDWQTRRVAPAEAIDAVSSRTIGRRATRRLQRTLVTLQVTVAVAVTAGATMLAAVTTRLLAVDPGFDPDRVATARLTLPLPKYDGPLAMGFFDALLERVRALPEVESATLANQTPPGVYSRTAFAIARQTTRDGDTLPSGFYTTAASGYQATLGLRLVRGRWLDADAPRSGVREVVVNETLANRYFAEDDPVGQRIQIQGAAGDGLWATVVGVFADVRNRGVSADPAPEIVGSVRHVPDRRQSQLLLVVRERRSGTVMRQVRAIVRAIDPDQPIYAVSTLAAQLENGAAAPRLAGRLLMFFGVLAMALSALGVYALLARAVADRTAEIGLRAALGASRASVSWLVVGQALVPVGLGVATAVSVVLLGHRTIAGYIFGATPDVASVALPAVLLTVVALLAAALPVVRALRVDPLAALRS